MCLSERKRENMILRWTSAVLCFIPSFVYWIRSPVWGGQLPQPLSPGASSATQPPPENQQLQLHHFLLQGSQQQGWPAVLSQEDPWYEMWYKPQTNEPRASHEYRTVHDFNCVWALQHVPMLAGFRLVNTKCMMLVDMWKKIQHSNAVTLREVFTTKAFGDHCKDGLARNAFRTAAHAV